MKTWKIQEEEKAKVEMVFAERVAPNTIRKIASTMAKHTCVGYHKRSMHVEAQSICRGCKWVAKQPRCDHKVLGDQMCWVFDSVSAVNVKESVQAK